MLNLRRNFIEIFNLWYFNTLHVSNDFWFWCAKLTAGCITASNESSLQRAHRPWLSLKDRGVRSRSEKDFQKDETHFNDVSIVSGGSGEPQYPDHGYASPSFKRLWRKVIIWMKGVRFCDAWIIYIVVRMLHKEHAASGTCPLAGALHFFNASRSVKRSELATWIARRFRIFSGNDSFSFVYEKSGAFRFSQ